MSLSDDQEKIAKAFGKSVYRIHRNGGVTLSQALNQAFTETNPDNRAVITAAIVASLVGFDLEDRAKKARSTDRTTFRVDAPNTTVVGSGPGVPAPDGDDTYPPKPTG